MAAFTVRLDRVIAGRELRKERKQLSKLLPTLAARRTDTPPPRAAFTRGEVSLRQFLTFVGHWRGPGGHHTTRTGIWPMVLESDGIPAWKLGPSACPEYPLLTDVRVVSLLCAGSFDLRPALEVALDIVRGLDLDSSNSPTVARATLSASLFYKWRRRVAYAIRSGLP